MASSSQDRGQTGRGADTDWEAITESEMREKSAKLAKSADTHNSEATASEVEVERGVRVLAHVPSPRSVTPILRYT